MKKEEMPEGTLVNVRKDSGEAEKAVDMRLGQVLECTFQGGLLKNKLEAYENILISTGAIKRMVETGSHETEILEPTNLAALLDKLQKSEAEAGALRVALEGAVRMWRSKKPEKLYEVLSWRDNDDAVERMIQQALSSTAGRSLLDKVEKLEADWNFIKSMCESSMEATAVRPDCREGIRQVYGWMKLREALGMGEAKK